MKTPLLIDAISACHTIRAAVSSDKDKFAPHIAFRDCLAVTLAIYASHAPYLHPAQRFGIWLFNKFNPR